MKSTGNQSQNASQFLRFADYIVVSGQSEMSAIEQKQSSKKHQLTGFLSAVGHSNHSVYFQSINPSISKQLQGDEGHEDINDANNEESKGKKGGPSISTIRNFRDFVFQIWPKLSSQRHKEYRKNSRQKQQLESEINEKQKLKNIAPSEKELQMLSEFEEKLKELERRKNQQKKQNDRTLQDWLGNYVLYGSQIELLHIDSHQFLNGRIVASEAEKRGYKLELSKDFASGMVFKFLPFLNYRNLGDKIQYSDRVKIQNQKLKCYINFKNEICNELDRTFLSEPQFVNPFPIPDYRTIDSQSKRYDTFLEQFSGTSWIVRRHGQHPPKGFEDKARGHSFIRLKHTEEDIYLAADISYQTGLPEAYLRRYNGVYDTENISISSIWEIEEIIGKQRGGFCKYGSAKQPNYFRLRHFMTGRLLSKKTADIKMENGQTEKKQIFVLGIPPEKDQNFNQEDSKLFFMATKEEGQKHIQKFKCYNLGCGEQGSQVYFNVMKNSDEKGALNMVYSRSYDREKETIKEFFQPLSQQESDTIRYAIEGVDERKDDQAFQVETLSPEQEQDLLFVSSTIPSLNRMVTIFKNGFQEEFKSSTILIPSVLESLQKLIFFVIKSDDKSPFNCDGISIEKRQRILRDMRFIELLTDLLYYPFANKFYNPKDLSSVYPMEMIQVFQLSYRLIKFIIREYRPNELYASQWLELFLNQALKMDPNENYDIMAEPTLTELIDNNKLVLENKIKDSIIHEFTNLLISETSKTKYVKLLRALINCNGSAIEKNQKLIVKNILESDPNVKLNVINPLLIDNQLEIQLNIEINENDTKIFKNVSLKEISKLYLERQYRNNLTQDETIKVEALEYYIDFMYLCADMCLDKQFNAVNILKVYFPIGLFEVIMTSQEYCIELRTAATEFFITLWLDSVKFSQLNLTNYAMSWKEIPEQEDSLGILNSLKEFEVENNTIQSKKSKNNEVIDDLSELAIKKEEINKFKEFFISYLQKINKSNIIQTYDSAYNGLTQKILKMGKIMLEYGLFFTVQELEELVQVLLAFLNGVNDVTNEDELSTRNGQLQNLQIFYDKIAEARASGDQKAMRELMNLSKEDAMNSRFEETENNNVVIESRIIAQEMIKTITRLRYHYNSKRFLVRLKLEYNELVQKYGREQLHDISDMFMGTLGAAANQRNQKQAEVALPISAGQKSALIDKSNQVGATAGISSLASNMEGLVSNQEFREKPVEWITDIVQTSIIVFRKLSKFDFNAVCLDLLMYENDELVNYAFQMIETAYSRRKQLINYLSLIQVIDHEDKEEVLKKCSDYQKILDRKASKTENWLNQKEEKGKKNALKCIAIIEQLIEFLMSKDIPLSVLKREQKEEPESEEIKAGDYEGKANDENDDFEGVENPMQQKKNFINTFIREDKFINSQKIKTMVISDYQRMMENLGLYEPIISILQSDLNLVQAQGKVTERDKYTVRLLATSYQFLSVFCFENSQNQEILNDLLTGVMEKHIIDKETLAYLVIREISRNNFDFLMNAIKVKKMAERFVSIINNLNETDNLKCILLDSLKTFMRLDPNIIKLNQVIIMESVSKTTRVMTLRFRQLYSSKQNCQDLRILCDDLVQKINDAISSNNNMDIVSSQQFVHLNPEIDYFNSQLELMSTASEDRNAAAESKCQNLFGLSQIQSTLDQVVQVWPIRRALYFYFYHVYLDTQKEYFERDQITKIMQSMNEDLTFLSNEYEHLMKSKWFFRNFQGILTAQDFFNEIICEIMFKSMHTAILKNLIPRPSKIQESDNVEDKDQPVVNDEGRIFYTNLLQSLLKIGTFYKNMPDNIPSPKGQNSIQEKIQDRVQRGIVQILKIIKEKINIAQSIQFAEGYLPKFSDIGISILQQQKTLILDANGVPSFNDPDNAFQKTDFKINQNSQQLTASEYFYMRLNQMKSEETLEKLIEYELQDFVQVICSVEKVTFKAFQGLNTVDFGNLIHKLVELVDPTVMVLTQERTEYALTAFRKIIERENPESIQPSDEWESQQWEPFKQKSRKDKII